ncbi:MAG: adenylate kinase, partial [Metallibacterium scheffleri]
KRLAVYAEQTAPVAEHYTRAGTLRVVDGVGSLDEVFARIMAALSAAPVAATAR